MDLSLTQFGSSSDHHITAKDRSSPSESSPPSASSILYSSSTATSPPVIIPPNHHSILPENHFLNLPRPDANGGTSSVGMGRQSTGLVDTTTVAAHDFDVDGRTGFMPPQPPLARLPLQWEEWEAALADAMTQGLRLGDTPGLAEEKRLESEQWREAVRNVRGKCFMFYVLQANECLNRYQ